MAESLDVEPITLARMIDRLEQAGLVERRRDETDRRAWRIYLTAAATPVVETLQTLGDLFHADALDGIGQADMRVVRDVLQRIRGNLNEGGTAAAGKVI